MREALFAALGAEVVGTTVLDLFAGSGALAIEALSRGASRAVLVERDGRAARVIADNLERTGLASAALVVRSDAARFCRAPRGRGPFDLILVDPPYRDPLQVVWRLLEDLRRAAGIASGASVVIERDRRDPGLDAPGPDWLAQRRTRSYGDTVLLFLRARQQPSVSSEGSLP